MSSLLALALLLSNSRRRWRVQLFVVHKLLPNLPMEDFTIPRYKQTNCERLVPRSLTDIRLRIWEDSQKRILLCRPVMSDGFKSKINSVGEL